MYYFVSTVKDSQVFLLLGPYTTHQEALDNVNRGKELACEANSWAWFYVFGTCSIPTDSVPEGYETVFGS